MEEYTPQQIESYTNEIKDICENHKHCGMIFKKKSYLKDFVEWKTSSHLSDPFYTFRTKLYWVVHDLVDFPKCQNPECRKPLEWKNIDSVPRGYCKYCCNSCAQKAKETQEKIYQSKHSINNNDYKRNEVITLNPCELSDQALVDTIWANRINAKGLMEYLENSAQEVYDELIRRTNFLMNCDQEKTNVPIQARLYCLCNHITHHPTCKSPNCENHTLWNSRTKSFNLYCCDKCRAKDPTWKEQVENTCMKKYNVKTPMKSKVIQSKYRHTCEQKYGVDNYARSYEYHKNKHHKFKSEKYPDLTFDSTWEVKVYEFCRDNHISIEYSPSISYPYEYDEIMWTYHPDFLINGKVYEVKGDQFFRINESTGKEEMFCPYRQPEWTDEQYEWKCGKFEAKHQCMLKNNVIILRRDDIKHLQEVFNHVYT